MSKVLVKLRDSDNANVFEGDYEVALGPDATLIVNEIVADVANVNKGNPIPKLKAIYNPAAWDVTTMEE